MGRFVAAVGIAALVCAVGCPSLGGYFCADDSDCNRGGQGGVCLADHACGYPDASGDCDSGLVRSPNADRLPGACVPVGDVAGGSTGEQSVGTAGRDDISGTGVISGSGGGETTAGPAGCGTRVSVELDVA
ncbi:MAG: hypothetical protein JKY37_10800, partial [Nannocystaceae bacterium]|nr:hypothetical protein [Nannocystaceae bacterium]